MAAVNIEMNTEKYYRLNQLTEWKNTVPIWRSSGVAEGCLVEQSRFSGGLVIQIGVLKYSSTFHLSRGPSLETIDRVYIPGD